MPRAGLLVLLSLLNNPEDLLHDKAWKTQASFKIILEQLKELWLSPTIEFNNGLALRRNGTRATEPVRSGWQEQVRKIGAIEDSLNAYFIEKPGKRTTNWTRDQAIRLIYKNYVSIVGGHPGITRNGPAAKFIAKALFSAGFGTFTEDAIEGVLRERSSGRPKRTLGRKGSKLAVAVDNDTIEPQKSR